MRRGRCAWHNCNAVPRMRRGRCAWHNCNVIPRMRRGAVPVCDCSFLRMICPEVFCRFRSPNADMPPLKGEAPAKQAVGFASAESGGGFLQPARVGSADRQSARSSCGFADFGRFNLWRPIVVNRTRGSMCVQAQPARPAASACRLSLSESAVPTVNPQGILRIRRNQPLQSMAAGFVCYPAAASACRLSLPVASGRQHC